MSVEITENGFKIDTIWTAEEHQKFQSDMDSWGTYHYHNIIITDGEGKVITTRGANDPHIVLGGLDHFGFPQDLTGKTVLDIGCNCGFYSIAAKLRGATHVTGVDISPEYAFEASWLRDRLGISEEDVTFKAMSGHELANMQEQFDFVINLGVIYHIENPMDYLRAAFNVTRGSMLLESEMLLDPAVSEYSWFIEKEYGCDCTNWWIYGPKCLERMARAAGFSDVDFEGFLWKPEPGTKTPEGFERQGRGVLTCRR